MSRLSEIKKRLREATPGPWTIGEAGQQEVEIDAPKGEPRLEMHGWDGFLSVYGNFDDPERGKKVMWANAEFVANAYADIRYLIKKLEETKKPKAKKSKEKK